MVVVVFRVINETPFHLTSRLPAEYQQNTPGNLCNFYYGLSRSSEGQNFELLKDAFLDPRDSDGEALGTPLGFVHCHYNAIQIT
ncbi:hypothetical protein E2C01_032921 [Portunus trituberculatus]|uniref:Uncharacterized protein n=1 Tax=Portunus trituberculatus TaxID=210409 RepID=A0A5B7F209_PORTR|nr:hypothetical protein [Portunus trituberculatus]